MPKDNIMKPYVSSKLNSSDEDDELDEDIISEK